MAKFCKGHFKALKRAVMERGMWGAVSRTDNEAKVRFAAMVAASGRGEDPPNGIYDPLLDCVDAINAFAIKRYGARIIPPDPVTNAHICPLCECDRLDEALGGSKEFIRQLADGARKYCTDHGVVGTSLH